MFIPFSLSTRRHRGIPDAPAMLLLLPAFL